jgi:photosystem II stability/assembly factor-like uncharacterized protein
MKASVRSLIHDQVLLDYQAPSPGLAARVLRQVPDHRIRAPRRRGRAMLQALAVAVGALAVVLAMIGIRAARGDIALPAGMPFGVGGLHPPAASYFIADAQFVSADTAWIVAQLHEHNGPTVVMNTTDGGQTWHEQFRIPDGTGYGGLRFWNARDGELTEMVPSTFPPSKVPGAPGSSNMVPRLYRTQDGGAHWQLVDRPVDWMGIGADSFFLDQQDGWRLVQVFHGVTPDSATVQRTRDGGLHWSTIGTLPQGAWLGALSFSDARTGWLVASASKSFEWNANGTPVPSTPPASLLWVTRDGGRSWQPVALPLPDEAAANNVHMEAPIFFGARNGLLEFEVMGPPPTFRPESAAGPSTTQGWTHSYIVTTTDGGRDWSAAMRTPGGLQEGGAFFFDARHWLMSSGPSLSETMDGGKTWSTRQVLADGLAFSLAPWNYVDAKTIWSQVGPNRLVRSTDGGAHWTSITPPTIDS